ncbi:CydD ABC-type transport system involved in cytochrome bd biosynthesis, ATPase and permease components [Candidatus Nanopelagicaceae bacterium]
MGSSRKLIFGALIGALINTAIVLSNGFLIGAVIIGLIYHHPNISTHIAALAALWAFRAIFTSQFDRWASIEASRLKMELRNSVLSSQSALLATPSTHLTTLLVKGANSLDIYLARFLPQMFGASLTPFVLIVAIATQDITSAVIALVTLPLIPVFGALIGRYTNDAVTAKWQSLGTLSKYFEDSLRGIYTLAIFGRHKSQGQRIREMGDRYTDETMKVLRISFLSALVLELAATISVAVIAVSIGLRLVSGSMDFFPALTVLVLAPEVYFPLRNAASLFHASADGGAALSELIELKGSAVAEVPMGEKELGLISSIQWQDWKSPYSRAGIEGQSVKSGELLVLRGGSGLGKTTFLNSILAMNTSAEIKVNGEALSNFNQRSLYNQIGWIPQNPTLLTGSLRQQFTHINSSISDEDIEARLNSVGLELSQLPHGLETIISGPGEKSGEISGGQRRRIAIARALSISPSLIIADEPTADLDPKSAANILHLLENCAAGGAIVIAVLHAPDQQLCNAREIEMVER